MDDYTYNLIKNKLESSCKALEKAESLIKIVAEAYKFKFDAYLFSNERAAVTEFYNGFFNSNVGIFLVLKEGDMIIKVLSNLDNHIITTGGISEEHEDLLQQARAIRNRTYENMAMDSL